jgi:two-component system sensor histidine kinase DegS
MTRMVAPPQPRPLDARVAESPVVGLRFHIDSRIGDLDDLTAELERQLKETLTYRANVLVYLRHNEDVRRHALEVMPSLNRLSRKVGSDVAACFTDGLSLTAELGRAEEHVAGVQRRMHDVAAERATLRQTSELLWEVSAQGNIEVDLKASRYSQAARQIFQIVDDEHATMAKAILDGPMQRLADAVMEAELLGRALSRQPAMAKEAAKRCREATTEAAVGLSREINNLDPMDEQHGLVAALRQLLREQRPRHVARLRVLGIERRLDALTELTAYRVVEESVDNAITHGRAQTVDVVLSFPPARIVVVVKDDGDGFDVSATEARLGRTRALGLIQMRERVRLLDGRLEVRSIPGMGTEVRATLPDGH